MIEIEIDNKMINCPESWDDVKLNTFEELLHFTKTTKLTQDNVLYSLKVFSILLKVDINILKKTTRAGFISLANLLSFANIEPTPSDKKEWIINKHKYRAMEDLNQLTMGDTLSIETILKDIDEAYITSAILPFIIRPVVNRTNEQGEIDECLSEVDYKKLNKTKELFSKELSIRDVLLLKDFFLGGERG